MPRALVTGAAGFVGRHLVNELLARSWQVRCSVRRAWANAPGGIETSATLDVGPETEWQRLLEGVDVVFHLANRAHVTRDTVPHPAVEFERVNVAGTARLARCAGTAGVRRFIFVSSIGVHGVNSAHGALTEGSPFRPQNPYAESKIRGEQAVKSESGHGMDYFILRPPLIYGDGVPGNFLRLLRVVASGIPLPLGGVRNLRSYAAVDNVVAALLACGSASAKANEAYVVADGTDFSTPELVRTLAAGMGRKARLVAVPTELLRASMHIVGMHKSFQQLCGTLQVDSAKLRRCSDWTPSADSRRALAQTARWYVAARSGA